MGGLSAGAKFPLAAGRRNLIGRDWECQVVLDDPQCSRTHAAIVQRDDAWWIEDCDSSNGTFVDDQRIDQLPLSPGVQVRVGGTRLAFSLGSPEAAGHSREQAPEGRQTLVLDARFNPGETGQYTLDFLRGHHWGEDLFFLFQLSVKLLGAESPNQVVATALERLVERMNASFGVFLWLSDSQQLKPKIVVPETAENKVRLDRSLTRRVIEKRHAIRIQHDTTDGPSPIADSICVPLIVGKHVEGAIHLYREQGAFADEHVQLAGAVANILARALARARKTATLNAERQRLAAKSAESDELIGQSSPMEKLKARIARVASAAGCVLLRGESGSGKELVARAIHRASPRADRPMLCVNCAAIPSELMESQLFGHKKGAFTGADQDHIGWFQQADLGTLFLDEIGDLTLEGQAKLLRILEGHPFLPVGSSQEVAVDVRVICATNRDLQEAVAQSTFREDLYYRLSVFEIVIPPLRQRGEDIELLVDHFLNHFRQLHGRLELRLSREARQRLLQFTWPGNVRQLRNVIDSAVVLAEGDEIAPEDLTMRSPTEPTLDSLRLDHWERKLIVEALQRTEGNIPQASKLLGISRATLYRKIDQYELKKST